MKRIAKTLKVLLATFVLSLAMMVVAACRGNSTEKVKVSLAGETADAEGKYSLTLQEGEEKIYTIITGTLTDYEFQAESDQPGKVTASVQTNTLTVHAVSAGTSVVTVSEKNGKAEDLRLAVTVEGKQVQVTAPTGLNLSGLDESSDGDGSVGNPHLIKFSNDKPSRHTLNVQPANASAEFVWTVGTIGNGTFVADAQSALTVTQEGKTLTLECDPQEAGIYYVRATSAADSEFSVYLKVEVTKYVPLTGITTDSFAQTEEEGYDYEFKTAKGSTWDMSDGMAGRGEKLLAGNVVGGNSKPLNLTYYANMYQAEFAPANDGATNTTWVITSDKENVFKMEADGKWTANSAGIATLTVTNTAEEASIKIKVEVVDTLYNGILKSAYDAQEVSSRTAWDFDFVETNGFDTDKAPLLNDWQLVMNKTTNDPDGDDGNQKIFYLGGGTNQYGICLEGRIDSGTGLGAGTITSLTWAKATIPAQATVLAAKIGNNDKVHGSYRIVLVEGNGTAHIISGEGDGWVAKATANNDGNPVAEYEIPASLRGQTVAIVIEHALSETDNNCELHIKYIEIKGYTPVTGVTLSESGKQVGQSGTYQIEATVAPANASYKGLTYTVTNTPVNGAGKVTVSDSGLVNVAADAPVGNYTIKVTSTDNAQIFQNFTLEVIEYVAVTSFGATLSANGREIEYGTQNGSLNGATIAVTRGSVGEVSYTDPALSVNYVFNASASITDVDVEFSEYGIVEIADGELKYVGVGTTTVTLKPTDNAALAISFTVTVKAFDETTSLIAGTNVTKTLAAMLGADSLTEWKNGDGMRHFICNTVDKGLSYSKINFDGDVIQFESHVNRANSTDPVNIGYNKVSVPENANYLNFKVRGHNDDRLLEGANLRVRILSGEDFATVTTVLNWTTVANRWKQQEEWYHLSVDISDYQGQDVILLFEIVGGIQWNGNSPAGTDGAAGGYLYLGEIDFTQAQRTGSYSVENGKVVETRLYGNNLSANGWTVSATKDAGNYKDGVYQPLVLSFKGAASEIVPLQLTTATFYSHDTQAKLAPWGVFPALDNSHEGNELVLESSDPAIFKVENGVLTPVATGTATLTVKAKAYAGSNDTVTFTATVKVELVSISIEATEKAVTLEAGSEYTLKYTVSPSETPVTYSVTAPAGGENKVTVTGGTVTVAADAPFGTYTVKIAATEDATKYDEVTVTVTKVTDWANKNAILDDNTGWKVNGSIDSGVGEGADLNRAGSYLSRTVDLTDLNTLTLGVRTFVRGGETDGLLWVAIVVNGQEIRIKANGAEQDTVLIDTKDSKFDSRNEFVYDLSAYEGQTVEIRIGIDQGTHVAIMDVALNDSQA